MFRLKAPETFQHAVPIPLPGGEVGTLEIEYHTMTRTGHINWLQTLQGRSDIEIVSDLVAGWQGVTDADGEPLEFSHENLAALLDLFPGAAMAIITAYQAGLRG